MLSHFKRKAVRTLVSLYLLFSNVGDGLHSSGAFSVTTLQNVFLTNCLWRALMSKLQIHPKWLRQTVWTVDTVKQSTSWRSRIMFYTTLYVSNTSAIPTCTNLRAVIAQPQQIRSCRWRSVLNTIVPVHSTASYM